MINNLKTKRHHKLKEEDRIYFDVPDYTDGNFAQYCGCLFDSEMELWFTDIHNRNILALIDIYGVHFQTSITAKKRLKAILAAESTKAMKRQIKRYNREKLK